MNVFAPSKLVVFYSLAVKTHAYTEALPPIPVAYRDAPGHTVALAELHRECIVTIRSITEKDRDQLLPQTGSGP